MEFQGLVQFRLLAISVNFLFKVRVEYYSVIMKSYDKKHDCEFLKQITWTHVP